MNNEPKFISYRPFIRIEDFVEEVMGYFLSWFIKPYLSTKRVVLAKNVRLIQLDKNLDCLRGAITKKNG